MFPNLLKNYLYAQQKKLRNSCLLRNKKNYNRYKVIWNSESYKSFIFLPEFVSFGSIILNLVQKINLKGERVTCNFSQISGIVRFSKKCTFIHNNLACLCLGVITMPKYSLLYVWTIRSKSNIFNSSFVVGFLNLTRLQNFHLFSILTSLHYMLT